jgi:ribokinase
LAKTRWIYFSSIDGNHKEFNKKLHDYVKKNKIKLGFNPGSRQMALGAKKLKTILSITDILFVNKQEAQRLSKKTENIKVLLKALSKKGPKIVVITDGKKGSYCYDGEEMWKIGVIDLPVVERTGSGDAYASAFLAALNYGHDVKEAMRWGSLNGVYAAIRMGPHKGLLSKKGMEKFLKKYKTFQPGIL